MLSEVRERETSYDITHMQNLKNTNELIYKQTDSQSQQTNLWLLVGKGVGREKD